VRIWIDLANSPHVAVMGPIVDELEARGWTTVLTARDHAQTVDLALARWPGTAVIGSESPRGRLGKARSVLGRARALARYAADHRPDVALSHGSYAQLLAARRMNLPSVTMMDYEYQPANHASFRLARRIVVPDVFPEASLRRCGARARKVVRYAGYKEELYLGSFVPDPAVTEQLGLDLERVVALLRPPPEGALYHEFENPRFEGILAAIADRPDVQAVILPRTAQQRQRYATLANAVVPSSAVDGLSLMAFADLTVGAGGTMNRESALIGTPTYTMFGGRLSAVDAALLEQGRMVDLRQSSEPPPLVKKDRLPRSAGVGPERGRAILGIVAQTVTELAGTQPKRRPVLHAS
jgi:predicted glycosyltransferase